MTNIFSSFFQGIFNQERSAPINFKILFKKKIFILNLILGLVLNLALWLLIYFEIEPQQEPVILHYNIYFGVDLIGDWYKIYALPLFGLVVFLLNFTLAGLIYHRAKVLSYFLVFVASLVQILLFLAGFFIILQNL